MRRLTRGRRWIVAMVVVALAGLAAVPAGLSAADHLDAPASGVVVGWEEFTDASLGIPGGDPRLDITDVYAWSNPDEGTTVLVMNVNPAAGVLSPTSLRPGAKYQFAIDNDGDFTEDLIYEIRASDGNEDIVLKEIDPDGAKKVIAQGSGENFEGIEVDDGGKLFVGLRDDPFFFDLVGFLDQIADGTSGDGEEARFGDTNRDADFFTGLNVTSIVLELPTESLTGDDNAINVWSRTLKGSKQVDRMGKPAINTVFIKGDAKRTYNQSDPVNDVENFGSAVIGLLEVFYDPVGEAQEIEAITGLLLPDVLTLDTNNADGFVPGLNGRQLADDVIDFELFVVTGGLAGHAAIESDFVDVDDDPAHNDGNFLGEFPYLSAPNS